MKRFLSILTTLMCLTFHGIAQECPYEINWMQGSSYSSATRIDNMTVISIRGVFAEVLNVSSVIVKEGKQVNVQGPNNFNGSFTISQLSKAGDDGNPVNLNGFKFTCEKLSSPLKDYGEYKMTFPAGFMTVDGTDNPQFAVTFTIEDNRVFDPIPFPVTNISPKEGEVKELRSVSFQISNKNSLDKRVYNNLGIKPGAKGLAILPDGSIKKMPFVSEGVITDNLGWEFRFYKEDENGNLIYGDDGLPMLDPFTDPGDYTFVVPEGTIRLSTIDGNQLITNERIEFNYSIKASGSGENLTDEKPVVTPEPGKTYTELDKFSFAAPAGYSIALPSPAKSFSLVFKGAQMSTLPVENDGMVSVSFGKQAAKGEYTLSIPQGAIEFTATDGKKYINRPIEFNYTVDPNASVDSIEASDGTVTVYDLLGKCVLENAPADRLLQLEKGIYVVNGKKQAIK